MGKEMQWEQSAGRSRGWGIIEDKRLVHRLTGPCVILEAIFMNFDKFGGLMKSMTNFTPFENTSNWKLT